MFKKLKDFVRKIEEYRSQSKIDPSQFNDAVASKTSWEPLETSSANFEVRKFTRDKYNNIKFMPTISVILFSCLFIIIGLVVGVLESTGEGLPSTLNEVWPFLFGLVFSLAGLLMLYFSLRPITFSIDERMFIKGKWNKKIQIAFYEIYAFQLLRERVTSSKSSYWSYQLNIVFENGDRENVLSYSNPLKALRDSEELASVIGVELWDAIPT